MHRRHIKTVYKRDVFSWKLIIPLTLNSITPYLVYGKQINLHYYCSCCKLLSCSYKKINFYLKFSWTSGSNMLPKSATILLSVVMLCDGHPADPTSGFDEAHDDVGLKDTSFPSHFPQKTSIGRSLQGIQTLQVKTSFIQTLGFI